MAKSVMQHSFAQVPRAEIPRSTFNRSHGLKTTFDVANLVPVLVDEALPGDTYKVSMTGFARMATPIFPLMDNLFMDSFFFAVPVRLLWENWQKFNGEQANPGDSTDFLVPQIVSPAPGYDVGSLSDYFGIPTGVGGLSHSALWHRGYAKIWNEWFRDQNLQDAIAVPLTDGPDLSTFYELQKRGKRHDYFTSCLPWPQKGEAVSIPLGGRAPISGLAVSSTNTYTALATGYNETAAQGVPTGSNWSPTVGNALIAQGNNLTKIPDIYADLTQATAATINSLRQAFQIQKIFERDARGGTRYVEVIKAHFGVTSPDARLQRSEYLGGGSTPVGIHPVAQTSGTAGAGAYTPTPQGSLAAYGTALMRNHGFTMSFTEHCIIIGLVSVRADLTYQTGLDRMWSRRTRFDFYWPALAHIGEQAVLQKEIFASGVPATDDIVFGYQERYAEYRYKPSRICGQMRSTAALTLDAWHLSQEFATAPVLDDAFITENPPMDRVLAVPTEPDFILDVYFNMTCARPMPTYGVPGLIDHF